MRPYYYIYYRFFVMIRQFDKTAAHWFAAIEITLMDYLIIWIGLFLVFPHWAESNLMLTHSRVSNVIWLMTLMFVPNYVLFIHKQRYRAIVGTFENESKHVKVIASVLSIVFLLLLVILAVNLQ